MPSGIYKRIDTKVKATCLECKKEFRRSPSAFSSKTNKGCGKYCSNSCKNNFNWANPEYRQHMSDIHKNKKQSLETIKKRFKNYKGENHYRWRENRTLIKDAYGSRERRSSIYKDWRRRICNRDNWKCKINNKDCSGRLEVHHILGFTEYPELKYDINNGITLCKFHHPRKRAEEKRLSPYFISLILKQNV